MSVVDEIKQRLDIVEFIGSYVPLQKAGANFKGLCPFHSEKTPSFVVFPENQGWHCFGACSTGGDLFSFVMRRENMEFVEALRFLAAKAGVELEPLTAEAKQQRDELERMREINALAADYYHHLLLESPEGAAGRDYFLRRGVTRETIDTFQLGYAPDAWHHLGNHLRSRGVSEKEALEAGLLSSNDQGNVYDRFRGRVLFPIRDAQGRVIGFGGRVLDDSHPKYLNTPQTAIFDKGSVLYGIDLARPAIRDTGTAIVVEGYMDVIIPYQCGIKNLVACMGTALSEAHIDALKRMTQTLILALDPDEAGIQAAKKGAETAREALPHRVVPVPNARGLIQYEERLQAEIRVLMLPDGMDPDELILSDPDRWAALEKNALPVADFFLQQAMHDIDVSTAKGKRQAAERMLPLIAAMESPVERAHYLQKLSQWIRVDERELRPQLERLRGQTRPSGRRQRARRTSGQRVPDPPRDQAEPEPRGLTLEERCLALLIENPSVAGDIVAQAELTAQAFEDIRHREIFERLVSFFDSAEGDYGTEILLEQLDTESGRQVESLLQRFSSGPPLSADMLREDLIKCSTRLRKQEIARRIEELRFVQQDAEGQGLVDQVHALSAKIKQLTNDYLQIEKRFYAATYVGRRHTM